MCFSMPCCPTTTKRNTIGVVRGVSAKLPNCTGPMLAYPMENEMSFIHHTVKQWECGCIVEDGKGLNERTQGHPMMKPMSKQMEAGWEQGRVLNQNDHKGLD
jgi:hypothetical protein